MRRLLALALVLAIAGLGVPATTFAATPQAKVVNPQVAGVARSEAGAPIANTTVRLRNTGNGEVVATSKTGADGGYSFKNVPAGNYVIELVDNNGAVVATSMPVSLSGTESVTGVALTAQAGKAGAGAVGGVGVGKFFTSTAGILLLAAAGGGLMAGVVGASSTTSPSK